MYLPPYSSNMNPIEESFNARMSSLLSLSHVHLNSSPVKSYLCCFDHVICNAGDPDCDTD